MTGEEGEEKTTFPFVNFLIHEEYFHNQENFRNDIALILLGNDVEFSRQIQPACLPGKDQTIHEDDETWFSGWIVRRPEDVVGVPRFDTVVGELEVVIGDKEKCFEQMLNRSILVS